MSLIKLPFVLAGLWSSLGTGRLSADWFNRLDREARLQPEAVGPVITYNLGRGSMTSVWGLQQAALIASLRPNHIWFETFAINDCVELVAGVPAVARADHIQNVKDMVALWRAAIPGVRITMFTMSSISATIVGQRPHYDDYIADDRATAALLEIEICDLNDNWPKPLDPHLTYGAGPPGFTAWPAWTFNPAAKNAHVTLAGGNLVATADAADRAVRANQAINSGSRYVGFKIDNPAGVAFGLGSAATSLADGAYVGSDGNAVGLTASGALMIGGVVQANYPALVAGDEVGIAYHAASGKVFFLVGSTWLNGDPAQLSGGFAAAPGNTLYPMVSLSPGGQITALPGILAPGDGLHPLGPGAVDVYTYPYALALVRSQMSDHFGLAA